MSIKSILCVFSGTPEELSSLNTALSLAKNRSAQLRILHITPPITLGMEGIIASGAIVNAIEADNEDRLKRAKEFVAHYTALHHVPLDISETPLHHASAKFIHCTGTTEQVVSQEGRMSDLLIISRNVNGVDIVFDAAAMTAIFDTGRPVLISPQLHGALPREWTHKTIAFLWNGSLEAARALYNAVPFLEEAEKVHILLAHKHTQVRSEPDITSVVEYLNSHNVPTDVIIIDSDHLPVEHALLTKAHQLKTDLIVMGAYGHTRTRELILGGATQHMLKNADIPLLLSH